MKPNWDKFFWRLYQGAVITMTIWTLVIAMETIVDGETANALITLVCSAVGTVICTLAVSLINRHIRES